jgi:hypothetical protein
MPSSIIAIAVYAIAVEVGASAIVAMAITMVASAIATRAFANANQPDAGLGGSSSTPDPGNRQQVAPATNNKLPVVYGTAWVGGIITDLTISENNQQLYYVLSLSEVTNSNDGQSPDAISFGDIYYGGKKVVFQENGYTVAKLVDESNGVEDTSVNGRIEFYLYSNGSNSPTNSPYSAIEVLQASGLTYTWDNTKLMSNCAFAILHLSYSQTANIRGVDQTRFQVINSRTDTGSCISDYLINTRYGAGLPSNQIDTTSLNALTAYSNEVITFTPYSGGSATQARFKFNGIVDTNRPIMDNLQDMSSCCDCLIKYNEITAKWGVIVNKPAYTVAMDINDSNMISAIQITPIDLAGSYNVVEAKFVENTNQDAFSTANLDLAVIDPALLLPNEPINKVTISLPLVNNNVQAQIVANRILKAAREDLQIQVSTNFVGIQLEAGDIVTVTNANYGWEAKPFRVNKVVDQFNEDGSIVCQLTLMEFNSEIYDDTSITEFTPSPNTGIGDPTFFGTVPAPTIAGTIPNGNNPCVLVGVTSSSSGAVQYAEVWYSAYSNPTSGQRFFAGTTAVQSSGNPYNPNSSMGTVTVSNLPLGNWYFFSRMVNSLASSVFSPPSSLLQWRPTTVQYTQRYLVVAYADDAIGTGFTTNPRNKTYYGLSNQSSSSPITNPALFTWFEADPSFSTNNYLLYINYGTRKFGFGTGQADYAAVTGSFVPTDFANYDPSLWSGLPDGTNYIDLDHRTGQLTETGTTTVGSGEIKVTNNADGKVVASLAKLLDFGGSSTYTASVAKLTIDIYGRVLGFEPPDDFNYTMQQFTASSGQTVFNVTRASTYLIDNCWVFKNGTLLDESDYTDTAGSTGTVTLAVGATIYDIITIVSFRASNLISGVYNAFSINYVDLVNANSYTASGFTLKSGYELIFLNGTVVNEQDYDIVGQTITNFPSQVTGRLAIYQWTENNLGVPAGTAINVVVNSVTGQDTYPFSYVANALNIYQNGVLLDEGTDYTAGFGEFTLANVPNDNYQILLQQTFDRTGAA